MLPLLITAVRRPMINPLTAYRNRDPELSVASFGLLLKTHLFRQYSAH